ncbi:MAG TPA: hypothetical protein VF530_22470 [Planctomycetota bacterium]
MAGASARLQEPGPKATIGQVVPDFTFRDFLAGGDGRQRLAEFRGQPVLIVNWTDTDFGRGASGEVEKLAKELVPEGLVLILLDTHNKTAPEIEAAVMRLYPGSPARLQENQKLPIEYLDNGPPPDIALIGVDGTLLVAGSYTADLNRASKLVKSELKRLEKGWGESEPARAARALLYGQERLAGAKAYVEEGLRIVPDHVELTAIRSEVTGRFEHRLRAVSYFREQGQILRAQEAARALAEAVKGDATWEARCATLLQEFEDKEVARELELDRKLSALVAPLAKKAPDREPEKLRKFAAEAGGTRVGKRALHLAEIGTLAARK